MKIPPGYRLMVVTPEGTVLDTIDLSGMDFSKSLTRAALIDNVTNALRRNIPRRT